MRFAADLHVHSRFSRATSSEADLAGYHRWAQVKGIPLVGTGDFTHPGWLAELGASLVEADGLYRLKSPPRGSALETAHPADIPVRFLLTAEISSIYKKKGRTRKVHSLIGVPSLDAARRLSVKLAAIGNIASDGRPILGLDPKDLFEILLETDPDGFLIPAHIWTPWFSLFGSKSGFDAIEDCFEELTPGIAALETGLSSDPAMNRRWSALDRFRLVSSSDAHSPSRLGREATLFDTDMSYAAVLRALRTGEGFRGTLEFYPEEGKYHLDGHRKCGVSMSPEQTVQAAGRCPVCGGPLTVGVLSRVLELADRSDPVYPRPSEGFRSIIPLPELIAELAGTGPGSKAVAALYARVIGMFGSEFALLLDAPLEDIGRSFGPLLQEAVRRMREGRVEPTPGFDGEFGVIRVFAEGELDKLRGQDELFGSPVRGRARGARGAAGPASPKAEGRRSMRQAPAADGTVLDPDQKSVLECLEGASLVFAGPGTGKTRVLTRWVARQVEAGKVAPEQVLALTFTNRAAEEMRERLAALPTLNVATFHSFCWAVLREQDPGLTTVCGRDSREALLRILFPDRRSGARAIAAAIEDFYERAPAGRPASLDDIIRLYEEELGRMGAADISSLVSRLVDGLERDRTLLAGLRERWRVIAVDELQDINRPQYRLLELLTGGGAAAGVLCIGDPDQSIYGFRGSDRELFFRFQSESAARTFVLRRNYRSAGAIVRASSGLMAAGRAPGIPAPEEVKSFGARLALYCGRDPAEEAAFIAGRIRDLVGGVDAVSVDEARERAHEADTGEAPGLSFSDIAVLFRTRAVRDALLPTLARAGLPLTSRDSSPLASEKPFCHLLAALRLIHNPADRVSAAALEEHMGSLDGLRAVREELRGLAEASGTEALIQRLLADFLPFDESDPGVVVGLETIREAARGPGMNLAQFLARVSLCAIESESAARAERVTLLTFHAAKGLEFPVVFIAGAEEEITPLPGDIEEERRLFYVAMTRAAERLFITRCQKRFLHGVERQMQPSRFLSEIPPDCIEELVSSQKKGRRGGDRRPGNQLSLFG